MPDTFPITPAHLRLLWIIIPLVSVVALLGFSLTGAYTARFDVSPAGLRLHGAVSSRLIPLSDLQLDAARVIDLRSTPSLAPILRTWGTSVPGYRSGWFRLRDGERALLYVTDPSQVAYIPTRAGYAILLSTPDPAALLASLQRASTSSGWRNQ